MSADVYAEDGYYAVIPEWVLDATIGAQAVRLYAVLRRYADKRTGEAHPSRSTLAERMHVKDVKTVDQALRELVAIAAIQVTERWRDEERKVRDSNGYRLLRQPTGVGDQNGAPPHGKRTTPPRETETSPPRNGEGGGGSERRGGGGSERRGTTVIGTTGKSLSPAGAVEDHFEAFWSTYPHKVARPKAQAAYTKALLKTDPATLLAAVAAHSATTWRGRDRQYIPHPTTWLNQERWADDTSASPTGSAPDAPSKPLIPGEVEYGWLGDQDPEQMWDGASDIPRPVLPASLVERLARRKQQVGQ